MTRQTSIAAVVIAAAAALLLAPAASADPDPHIPDADNNYCPGGKQGARMSGDTPHCLGEPFADGTFYSQGKVGSVSGYSLGWGAPQCSRDTGESIQPAMPDGCNGRPTR